MNQVERLSGWAERHARIVLLGSLLFVTALVLLSMRAVEWSSVAALWARANGWWALAAVIANVGVVTMSAVEWRLLLPPGTEVSLARMWRVNALAGLAVATTPLLAGHGAGVALLAREPGVGLRSAASVLALDQLGEGLAKLTLIAMAMAVAPVPDALREGARVVAIAVGALMVALLVLGPRLLRIHRTVIGGAFPLAFAAILAMKGAEGVGVLLAQKSLGIDLPVATLAVVLSATALGTMLPITPGQVGTYEASAFLAYRWLGVGAEEAMALAVVQHICYLAGTAGVGYLTLGWIAARARASAPPSRTPRAPG